MTTNERCVCGHPWSDHYDGWACLTCPDLDRDCPETVRELDRVGALTAEDRERCDHILNPPTYLYCRECGFHHGPNAASVTECPECSAPMRLWKDPNGLKPPHVYSDAMYTLARHCYETEEASFVRHLRYCLYRRHFWGPPGEFELSCCRDALWMLRLKRAIMNASPEERRDFKLDELEPDRLRGWVSGGGRVLPRYAKDMKK